MLDAGSTVMGGMYTAYEVMAMGAGFGAVAAGMTGMSLILVENVDYNTVWQVLLAVAGTTVAVASVVGFVGGGLCGYRYGSGFFHKKSSDIKSCEEAMLPLVLVELEATTQQYLKRIIQTLPENK
jgi:hypothetical protein